LNNIRILLTILVIFHHTAFGYGAWGSWFYVIAGAAFGPLAKLAFVQPFWQLPGPFLGACFSYFSTYFMPKIVR
jgi:hypothetical protein